MSDEARSARPQLAVMGCRCMNSSTASQACARRRSSPAQRIAWRMHVAESWGIMRAHSTAVRLVPWARDRRGSLLLELGQGRGHESADHAIMRDQQLVVVEPASGVREQAFAVGTVGNFVAQDANQSSALVLAHPGKAETLAGLLLVVKEGTAAGIQRAHRGQLGCGDAEFDAEVAQQNGRHDAHAVERPAAHAHKADVQGQSELQAVAASPI